MEDHWKYIEYNLNDSSKLILYNIALKYGPEYALQAATENKENIPPIPEPFTIFKSKYYHKMDYGAKDINYGNPFVNSIPLIDNRFCISFLIHFPTALFPFQLETQAFIVGGNDIRVVMKYDKIQYMNNGQLNTVNTYDYYPYENSGTLMQYNMFYDGNKLWIETYDLSQNIFKTLSNYQVNLYDDYLQYKYSNENASWFFLFEEGHNEYVGKALTDYVETFE